MQQCDTSKSGYLSGDEISHFYDLLTHREEIDVIYREYAKTTGFMSPENVVEFLMKEQREKATLADARQLVEQHEPDESSQYLIWIHVPSPLEFFDSESSIWILVWRGSQTFKVWTKGKQTIESFTNF